MHLQLSILSIYNLTPKKSLYETNAPKTIFFFFWFHSRKWNQVRPLSSWSRVNLNLIAKLIKYCLKSKNSQFQVMSYLGLSVTQMFEFLDRHSLHAWTKMKEYM